MQRPISNTEPNGRALPGSISAPATRDDRNSPLGAFVRYALADPSTSWSIGGFGALAEFHHSADATLTDDAMERVSARGAIRIAMTREMIGRAYELLSARAGLWLHGLALCLPQSIAQIGRGRVMAELGPDADAIRLADRAAVLFDLGLGLGNAMFCVRTSDPVQIKALRAGIGRNVLEAHELLDQLKRTSPHRVLISALGRIEVYQAIGVDGGASPEGPHTHLLPHLLRKHRTHAATLPIPAGYLPCLSIYPSNPMQDEHGFVRTFDRDAYDRFQDWLGAFGDPDFVRAKLALFEHVRAGATPENAALARHRIERYAWRIASRQLAQVDGMSPALAAWRARFDPNEARGSPDAH